MVISDWSLCIRRPTPSTRPGHGAAAAARAVPVHGPEPARVAAAGRSTTRRTHGFAFAGGAAALAFAGRAAAPIVGFDALATTRAAGASWRSRKPRRQASRLSGAGGGAAAAAGAAAAGAAAAPSPPRARGPRRISAAAAGVLSSAGFGLSLIHI